MSLANIGDLMLCYGALVGNVASLSTKRQFMHDLENAANDRLVLKDKFTTVASANYLWGYAKFLNRKINPYFNTDPASCLLNRFQISKVTSVTERVPRQFVKEILA